jgi:hypothetical protein
MDDDGSFSVAWERHTETTVIKRKCHSYTYYGETTKYCYTSENQGPSTADVVMQRFTDQNVATNLDKLGKKTDVAVEKGSASKILAAPQISTSNSGSLALAWESKNRKKVHSCYGSGSYRYCYDSYIDTASVKATRYNMTGGKLKKTPSVTVAKGFLDGDFPDSHNKPSVAMDDAGNFQVLWLHHYYFETGSYVDEEGNQWPTFDERFIKTAKLLKSK